MFTPEETAQFGWSILCRAAKEVILSAHEPMRAYEVAELLGWHHGHPQASKIVAEALKYLEAQGEPVSGNGGWWRYDQE